MDICLLNVRNDYACTKIRYLLCYPHMIRMKVRYHYIADILYRNPQFTHASAEGRKITCPPGIKQKYTCVSGNKVSICI